MAAIAQVAQIGQALTAGLSAPAGANAEELQGLVRQLKMLLTTLPSQTGEGTVTAEERNAARTALEAAALVALLRHDSKGFERTVAQIRQYFEEEGHESPAAAELRRRVQGMFLLHLLVESKLADFHSEVEKLRPGDRESPFVAFPLRLDSSLMEGSYNKVLAASKESPSPHFSFLLKRLADTVRWEIASCINSSYKSIGVAAAAKMMSFSSSAELLEYVSSSRPNWFVEGSSIRITDGAAGAAAAAAAVAGATAGAASGAAQAEHDHAIQPVEALTLINNVLVYASEVERIV